ncbi:bowman-birk serine protease inhibitor family protein (macronuclear) [Tetrahymena thermophila SB210]|uniref:Bowman-birk serine protease inhibitor family protein n=1 Tax=Tetrahymena thermophila (strain SB210) TaxID=312017 RepID=Q24F35_TETTS|nr:bowman-birk serine protease inhibitor family protein [Tetrahymena thermophila SB210]EAS06372.2 bowman-birk serine protease inhibitor family protein [Tetrahymena thermophila SB210]|eukprot:XP_001026617.2 bowman-birk serine protease inhibitor family protein [Tetrahymena thermophila SB210]
MDDYTALQTQLVWNFDFFYTKANPKTYFNVAKQMKIYPSNYDTGDSQILLVKQGTVFKTDYVNPLEFGGLVVTFHFKISSLQFANLKLFQIVNNQVQISISLDSSQNIYLNTQQIQGVQYDKWNQITLIVKTLILNQVYLIVNTLQNQAQNISFNQQFLLGQLQFGDLQNTSDIQFSHIRYYKGTFLTSNEGNCLLQNSRNTVSCIICQSGFFINYQSSLTCSSQILPSIDVNKDNIIDWNENFQSCPKGMVYDPISYQCNCMNQFYLQSNNTCAKCPSYCDGCINQQTCIQQDPQRLANGICQNGYFDDGFECQQCSQKCDSCLKTQDFCLICSNYRINPPECNCDYDKFMEINGICTQIVCDKSCDKCQFDISNQSITCLKCKTGRENPPQCTCLQNYEENSDGSCSQQKCNLGYQYDSNTKNCIVIGCPVGKSLTILNNQKLCLENMDVSLSVSLNTNNTKFVSTSQQFVLNQIYTKKQIQFEIGPFLLEESTLANKMADQAIDYFKNQNQDTLRFFQSFQIILYILNTVQPSVLFLLLKAQLPPNLYKFYQMIGLLIYPDVVDYQSTNFKQEFELFYMDLNSTEVYQSGNIIFKKLGFSNSFLINKFQSINQIAKQRINSENDSNLLMVIQSIMVQFTFLDQQSWAVRYEFPIISCILNAVVFIISATLTYLQKPYKNCLSRYIKLIGEIIMSVCWFIHIFITCIMCIRISPKISHDLQILKWGNKISNAQNYYKLSDGTKNIDCDRSLNSQVVQGIDIFQNIGMNTPASILNISGWIFLRGFQQKYYTIFSIHQASNLVFSLQYTLVPSPKMKVSLYSIEQTADYSFLTQKQWLFFMTQINYSQVSLDLSSNTYLIGNNINVALPSISFNTNIIHFDKNNLFINFGLPGNSLSVESSCSFTRDFVIVWDFDFYQSILGARRYDLSDFKTYILWNYDLFYIKSNQGQLISQQVRQSKIKSPFLFQQNDNQGIFETLRAGQVFTTDFINVSDVQGLTFSFQVYLTGQILSDTQIITLISENSQLIFGFNKDYKFTLKIIENGNKQEQQTLTRTIQYQEWTQFLMVFKIGLFQKVEFQISSNSVMNNFRFKLIKINKNVQVKFGSTENLIDIKFNNIFIVKGSYLGFSQQCLYLLPTNQCLVCSQGQYSIDFQNNMNCVDQSTIIQNPDGFNQKLWNRTVCAKDQLNVGNDCICRNQFYKQGNECFRCPSYCNGCISAQICKEKHINRNNQGQCQSGYFDDGFNCILRAFSIQEYNLALNYQNSQYNCNLAIADSSLHTFDNNLMQIQQNQSILYSFSFSLTQQPADYSVISILTDNGIEVFTILAINKKIHVYIQGNDALSIEFKESETTWVAIYTNWNLLQLFVFTEAQMNVKSAPISPSIAINSPKICVGSCYSTVFPKYICANLGERPFILIKDISIIQEKTDILFLISKPMIKIAQFRSIKSSLQPEQIILINQSQQIFIDFQDSLKYIDEFKGFLFDQNTSAQIILDTTYQSPITFSTSIFIEKMEKTVLLLSYDNVQYYLVPQEDLNRIFIRICFKLDCADSNYSSLIFNEPNFLLILYRNKSPFTTDYSFLQFEVYCNYKKEQLNIVQSGYQISFFSNLMLGLQNQLDETSMFLNNISLYTGDGYLYSDYTNLNNCFIYINISPRECLVAKQDHLVINGKVASIQECLNLNKNYIQNQGYYQINPFTKECFIKCLIQNAFPDQKNNCICNKGYFLSIDQNGNKQCKKCSKQCKTCLNNQDYCLECQSDDLIAPQCQCHKDNFYLDQNNQCQICSPQCKSCEKKENNCLACTNGRTNPPLCECDHSEFDIDGNQCSKRNCSKKCQKCLQDLNTCTQCSKFRENPPICNCQYGYFQGINENCVKCNLNEYFDNNLKICIPCLSPCLTCSQIGSNCQSCINEYILDGNVCKCPNGNISQISEKGDIYCLELMDLTCQIKLQQNIYKITLTFEHSLRYFDIQEKSKQIEIVSIYIPQIEQSAFSINNFQIYRENLSFDFVPKASFLALSAKMYIKYPQIFISQDSKYILSDKYVKKPFEFEIGPYIISQQTQESIVINSALEVLNDQINQNQVFTLRNFNQ